MTKQEFIEKIAPYVQQYASSYGIKVHSPIIAQAVLESWNSTKNDLSTLAAKYHNYFGMKCGSKWTGKSVNLSTNEEYEAGVLTSIRDNFRVFDSMEEGVKGYFEFIQLSRYQNLKGITEPRTYLETIKADGYATDSSYVSKCMKLVEQFGLDEKYDGKEDTTMAKYISHASIGSNGSARNDSAGDGNKKEVCIRTWYNMLAQYVIRIANRAVREQFANNMIDIAKNDNVGYDQNGRNTLLTQAIKVDFDFTKIVVKCECDCSSMVTIALLGAIYKVLGRAAYEKAYAILVVGGNCATTSTLRSRMKKLTMIDVNVYSSTAYTRSTTKAVFGDIYIKEGSHVVAYIDDGNKVDSGMIDLVVLEWQNAAIADGFTFPKYGADGDWGAECENVAKKAIVKKRLVHIHRNLTKIVQNAVGVEADGKCGSDTKAAIIEFQKAHGLEPDGCVGLDTWKVILKVN